MLAEKDQELMLKDKEISEMRNRGGSLNGTRSSSAGTHHHHNQSNSNHLNTSNVDLSTSDLESPPVWVRRNNTELARVLLAHGIKPNNTEMVILYGNPDPMASFRAAIIMKSMGVKNIRILNGGYQSW
jgi:3-mercaptopyruvate sulfurtransferase SseA